MNPNYNLGDLSRLENTLLYWGKTYEERFKDISIRWIEKEYKKIELSNKKKKKKKPIYKKRNGLILEDLTKEELIEVIRIRDDYDKWIKKHNEDKKTSKFMYIDEVKDK